MSDSSVRSEDPAPYITEGSLLSGLEKIVSGGQTGVDRAALNAAMDRNFPVGGWCPEGRLAEDGLIPDRYPLKELPGGGYRQRTRRNVQNSNATLILYYDRLSGGTEQTLAFCIKEKKPYLLIDVQVVAVDKASEKLVRFLHQEGTKVLNVAGPRASAGEWTHAYTYALISTLLRQTGKEPVGTP